jgi:hypothetical protein
MNYIQADFQPVLPNITDDSMKEIDEDVETVRNKKNIQIKPSINKKKETNHNNKTGNSIGRKIIIGSLIIVIIILIILLIYQIYKYYNTDGVLFLPPELKTHNLKNTEKINTQPNSKLYETIDSFESNKKTETQSIEQYNKNNASITKSMGCIPENVRNLDDNLLSKYIQKEENTNQQKHNTDNYKKKNSIRDVSHESMLNDTSVVGISQSKYEMGRISEIIDDNTTLPIKEIYDDNLEIPSREELLLEIKNDMDNDKKKQKNLSDIEEENGDNVIDDFLNDDYDETSSNKSEDGGCQFELIKGKNRGHQCGRKRINGINCSRHRDK